MQPLIMHRWTKSAERNADLLCTTALLYLNAVCL